MFFKRLEKKKNVHYSAYFDEKGVIPYLEIPFPYQKKLNSYPLTFKFSLTLRRKTQKMEEYETKSTIDDARTEHRGTHSQRTRRI